MENRGCKAFRPSNAKNFVDADCELRGLWEAMKASTENNTVQRYLNEQGIRWHFIPPKSPHFSGLWEATVKAFKRHFVRVVGDTLFNYEALHNYINEIEAILNFQPFSPPILTTFHLLCPPTSLSGAP